VGFPVMIKAAAGGGGKGMRRVDDPADLVEAIERAASEAKAAFGDDRLYLEKCIERPRHVEVQVLADDHGQAVHLFERECSIQRRHQKIIEEAPCPNLDSSTREQLCDAALRVVREADYRGAGTVEFLLAPDGSFTFMEVNARLQVEHPVTEAICGLDLVRHQIRLAAGEALGMEQADIQMRGHAIECRIYAEDALNGFMPSPGEILDLVSPQGPGVRFDCGVAPGSPVPVHYDPILAKLITSGENRSVALARMERALAETAVLGVQTPIELLLSIVGCEPFRQGRTHTAFLSEFFADWRPDPDRRDILLLGWLVAELSGLRPGAAHTEAGGAETVAQPDPWASLGRVRLED
jgi:acetyl/propionyl-CoA carboxylase alpha subunit